MPSTPSPEVLAQAIRAARMAAPASPLTVLVTAEDVQIIIPPEPPPARVKRDLKAREQRVVDVIGRGPALTRQEIAERLGVSIDGGIAELLAALRAEGVLTGAKGTPGYGVAIIYLPPVPED